MLTEQKGIQVDKFYPPTDWQYSFPEGYTRLEYLESTGTQYIDTGVYLTGDSRVKIKAQTSYTGDGQRLFGTQYTNKIFRFGTSGSVAWYPGYYNGAQSVSFSNDKNIFELDFNKNNVYINNELIKEYTYHSFTASNTAYLFTINATSLTGHWRGKVYNCLIWDSGSILIRNLVPVKRNSDNKPGMYDLVNNVFYINQGTGEFVMGTELYSNNSQIDIRQKNNTNFVEKYKFNENNELVWANPQLNLSGPVNYSVVGNPTITDSVVSGFSASDYLTIPNVTDDIKNFYKTNFEMQVKVILSSTLASSQVIYFPYKGTYNGIRIAGSGKIQWYMYSGTYTITTDVNTVLPNNTYYIKTKIKNSLAELLISNNGTTWTSLATLDLTDMPTDYTSTNYCRIGVNGATAVGDAFNGSVDLKETYIKVNDKLWFYGKNYTSENYAPVPAGLNYNNTTTPSIGYVNTQTQEFIPAPTDGIKYSQTRDIKVVPPEDNTITLLYGVASDFSKYALFGLLASVSSGTYDVYIDDVLYTTTVSNTQTDIDFSTLGAEYVPIGTATTPEELALHKIVIKPNTSGATITKYEGKRTIGITGTQEQGILWAHFELENEINLQYGFSIDKIQPNLLTITAKGDKIKCSNLQRALGYMTKLLYCPTFDFNDNNISLWTTFNQQKNIKRLKFENGNFLGTQDYSVYACQSLEQIKTKYFQMTGSLSNFLYQSYSLKILPNCIPNKNLTDFIVSAKNLYPTKIDISSDNTTTKLGTYGTSTYPMRGLRGLKVSNEAPFTGGSPQINVSYTGLDRDALVELFNSLPTVTDGQTINITAATGNNLTKVGTPTIDENGVASGFSGANRFNLPRIEANSYNRIELNTEIETSNTIENGIIIGDDSYYIMGIYIVDESIRLNVNFGTYINIASSVNLETNTKYTIKAILDITNKKLSITVNNITNSTENINITTVRQLDYHIGYGTRGGAFNGSIDLENTYIKVGQNYIMKGYLTDNDRLIATNKGWTITG